MIWAGFILGIMSSFHCIGMCGPIAMALPVPIGADRWKAILLYNFGRVLTYSIIGLAFGLVGQIIALAGFQRFLSVFSGVLILLMVVFPFVGKNIKGSFQILSSISSRIKNRFHLLFRDHSFLSLFIIGILNGLLPCGLVYIALVGAIALGNSLSGSLYMILFGLGTVPAMAFIGYSKRFINLNFRKNIQKSIPYLTVFMGIIFILRGMNIGIPYISPKISTDVPSDCCKIKCH